MNYLKFQDLPDDILEYIKEIKQREEDIDRHKKKLKYINNEYNIIKKYIIDFNLKKKYIESFKLKDIIDYKNHSIKIFNRDEEENNLKKFNKVIEQIKKYNNKTKKIFYLEALKKFKINKKRLKTIKEKK